LLELDILIYDDESIKLNAGHREQRSVLQAGPTHFECRVNFVSYK